MSFQDPENIVGYIAFMFHSVFFFRIWSPDVYCVTFMHISECGSSFIFSDYLDFLNELSSTGIFFSQVSVKVEYPQDYADLSREGQKDFKQTRYGTFCNFSW